MLLWPSKVSWDVKLSPDRLLFQCRYSGTAVEALVMEVNAVPPPVPVAAAGPLRVELKLGNGQCHSKGCVEDERCRSLNDAGWCRIFVALRLCYFSLQRWQRIAPSTLQQTIHSLKCWGSPSMSRWTSWRGLIQTSSWTWSTAGPLPPQILTASHSGTFWLTGVQTWIYKCVNFSLYSMFDVSFCRLQVSLPRRPLPNYSSARGRLLWASLPDALQTFHR